MVTLTWRLGKRIINFYLPVLYGKDLARLAIKENTVVFKIDVFAALPNYMTVNNIRLYGILIRILVDAMKANINLGVCFFSCSPF